MKRVLTVVLAGLLTLGLFCNPAQATTVDDGDFGHNPANFSSAMELLARSEIPVQDVQGDVNAAMELAIRDVNLLPHGQSLATNLVRSFKVGNETLVAIPIDADIRMGSFWYMMRSGQLVRSGKVIVQLIQGTFSVTAVNDRGEHLSRHVQLSSVEEEQLRLAQGTGKAPGKQTAGPTLMGWDSFNACLASIVPANVMTAFGVACGFICAWTLGAGCIVCATAALGAYAFRIGQCLARE